MAAQPPQCIPRACHGESPSSLFYVFSWFLKITGDRFHTLSLEVLERRNDEWMCQPTLEFLELHLLMAHYYNSAKRADAGEDMWNLSGKMIGIATALGLHRDPEHWGMSPEVAARRRWAWWNVLSFERWVRPYFFVGDHTYPFHQVHLYPIRKTAITWQQRL